MSRYKHPQFYIIRREVFVSVTITLNLSDKTSAHNVSLLLPLNLRSLWYVNRKCNVITGPVSYLWAAMYVHILLPYLLSNWNHQRLSAALLDVQFLISRLLIDYLTHNPNYVGLHGDVSIDMHWTLICQEHTK